MSLSADDPRRQTAQTNAVGFLNDLVAQLWPNICVVTADMTKSIVEPMFASMLPKPVNSLHFAKIDLGRVPFRFGNVDVHRADGQAIKMDLDVDWDGECDIELDGTMIPKIGIEHVKLQGRLSVLLDPLLNKMPLVRERLRVVVNASVKGIGSNCQPERHRQELLA